MADIAVGENSRNKSPDAAKRPAYARQQMFSTPGDSIPENTFAGFLGLAEATATVGSRRERGTNRHLRKNKYTRLSSGGRRCREDEGRHDLRRDPR